MHTSSCLDRCAVGVAHGLCTTTIIIIVIVIEQHNRHCSKRIMNAMHGTCVSVGASVLITKTPTVTTHSPTAILHTKIFLLVRSACDCVGAICDGWRKSSQQKIRRKRWVLIVLSIVQTGWQSSWVEISVPSPERSRSGRC